MEREISKYIATSYLALVGNGHSCHGNESLGMKVTYDRAYFCFVSPEKSSPN